MGVASPSLSEGPLESLDDTLTESMLSPELPVGGDRGVSLTGELAALLSVPRNSLEGGGVPVRGPGGSLHDAGRSGYSQAEPLHHALPGFGRRGAAVPWTLHLTGQGVAAGGNRKLHEAFVTEELKRGAQRVRRQREKDVEKRKRRMKSQNQPLLLAELRLAPEPAEEGGVSAQAVAVTGRLQQLDLSDHLELLQEPQRVASEPPSPESCSRTSDGHLPGASSQS